jgi:hypothetical protein
MSEEPKRPAMGQRGYYPDHAEERRLEYQRTTPGQRVAEAIELSRVTTRLAVLGARRR